MIYIYCTCISNVDSEFIRCMWYILNYIFIISYSTNILRISMIMTLDTHFVASNLPGGVEPQSQICQLWRFAAWSLDQSQANCLSARGSAKLLRWTYCWKNYVKISKKKNGSKMIKAEKDVNSCLNTWRAKRDLKDPECPCYVSQVPSQWLGRLENAEYKQCSNENTCCTYMLIWIRHTM